MSVQKTKTRDWDFNGRAIVNKINQVLGSTDWQLSGGSMSGADIVNAIDLELGSTNWQLGGGASVIMTSEADAKTSVGGNSLTPGALYVIALDGSIDGKINDFLFIHAIEQGNFATTGWYYDNVTTQLCFIQCTFTGSGLLITQGDMTKTISFNIDTSSGNQIDIQPVKMYGNIDLNDTGGSYINSVTGLAHMQKVVFRNTAKNVSFTLNAGVPHDLYIQKGFVGFLRFDDHDSLEIVYNENVNRNIVHEINAVYSGGPREYTALLTQTMTNPPTSYEGKNTLGANVFFGYSAPGEYVCWDGSSFLQTWANQGNVVTVTIIPRVDVSNSLSTISAQAALNYNDGFIYIQSYNSARALANDVLSDSNEYSRTTFKIEVHPL